MKLQAEVLGRGPPLVLVPGGLTGWLSWAPHASRLAASHRVTRVQLLSVQHGLEDRPLPDGYDLRMESAALAETLGDLDLPRPYDLAGWSMGALIALDHALDHPGRIRSLTLIEPPAIWLLRTRGLVDSEARAAVAGLRGLRPPIGGPELARFLQLTGLVPPGSDPRELEQWPLWMEHRRSLRNVAAVLDHLDVPARLGSLRAPMLLVKGHGSAAYLHRIVDELAELVPQAERLDLPGGHAPHLASMDAFLRRFKRFLSRTTAEPHRARPSL